MGCAAAKMSQFKKKATMCGGTTRGAFDAEMAHLRAAAWRLGENRPPVRRKSSMMGRHPLRFSPAGERFWLNPAPSPNRVQTLVSSGQ
jgi:hypothetical protein